MSINLDQSLAEALNQGMNMGGALTLPFPAPTLWVVNGNAQLKQLGGAQYFGGWAANREDIDEARQQNKVDWLPSAFHEEEIVTKDNQTLLVYTARNILCAPIAMRRAWVTEEGKRTAAYPEGQKARQHVQVLAYLAGKADTNSLAAAWGPVVLSAKGFQANNLMDSFTAWNKHTQTLRRKIAPGVPAWCFYLAIGTFGERKTAMVGKSGAQSPITPISAFLPTDLTEQTLEKLFVQNDIAGAMGVYLGDAAEWLNAWKVQQDNGHAAPVDDFPLDPVEPGLDASPF